MLTENLNFLKEVLSVPTVTYDEYYMVTFLCEYLDKKGYDYYIDAKNNIYVTKGESEYYPCVISHTDTVHNIDTINVMEKYGKRPPTFGKHFNDTKKSRLLLYGLNNEGRQTGIGGDDKCGIYVCLQLLEHYDNIKAAFFVSEETGCHGSRVADPEFFKNVGYTIQFDAPGNHLVTEVCAATRLFQRDSEFYRIFSNVLSQYGEFLYQSHPYTDIREIKRKFDHACLNVSCGYYKMHSRDEMVDVNDVEQTVEIGKSLIDNLGWVKYEYVIDYEAEERLRQEEFNKYLLERKKEYMAWRERLEVKLKEEFGDNIPPQYMDYLDDDDDFFLN